MAARAMWKAVVRFEELELPVKLYAGVEDQKVHFHLLHRDDGARLKQRMVHPETDEPVERDEIVKGYEVEPGLYVMLGDEELAALEPEASRTIEVTRFVEPAEINHQWYDRPYFLGPDGADDDYFAFAAALEAEGREGVARWVMRKKEYRGALRAEDGYLRLMTLRHAGEVIQAAELPAPEGRDLNDREVEMAHQLVEALAAPFELAGYADRYREEVRELIETKARGGTVEPAPEAPPEETETEDLEDLLAASLGRGGKGAGRPAGGAARG